MKNKEKGITLVALAVTIIILLILAGVAINMALGDNGLFKKSKEAVNTWKGTEINEADTLGYLDQEWDNLVGGSSGSEGMITFSITYDNDRIYEDNGDYEFTVKKGTTWREFLAKNNIDNVIKNFKPESVQAEEQRWGEAGAKIDEWFDYDIVWDYDNFTDSRGPYGQAIVNSKKILVRADDVIEQGSYQSCYIQYTGFEENYELLENGDYRYKN